MSIYTGLLGFAVFLGIIFYPPNRELKIVAFSKKEINKQNVYCFILATLIILLIGLRASNIGSDTPGYFVTFSIVDLSIDKFLVNYIDYLKEGFWNFFSDKNTTTFRLVFSLFKSIGLSFNACLVALATVYVVPIFYLISKESSNVWKSCFWYLVFSLGLALSGIRITFAIGLTTISYVCLLKHKRIMSILVFVLAVVIHLSAIVFVVVFFLEKLTIEKKSIYYIVPSFLIAPIIGRLLTPILLRYTYYQDAAEMPWNLSIYLFYAVTTVLLIRYSSDENSEYHKMMFLGTIMCGLINYGAFGNTHRYFTQYLCVCLPGQLSLISNRTTRAIIEIMYYFVGIYLFMRTFSPGSSLVPYKFFWQ